MKHIFHFILLFSLLGLEACNLDANQSGKENTKPDSTQANNAKDAKPEKEISKDFKKIICISPAITEAVIVLGDSSKIVATDRSHPRYPEFIRPKVGYEKTLRQSYITKHKPDLVLSDREGCPEGIANSLEENEIEVLRLEEAFNYEESKENLLELAKYLRKELTAKKLIAKMDSEVQKIAKELLKNRSDSVRVLYVYARGPGNLLYAGTNTALDGLIQLAGAKNAAFDTEGLNRLTIEEMQYYDPDFILMSKESVESFAGRIYDADALTVSRAYRTGRLVTLEEDKLKYLGIYSPKYAYELAEKLYKQAYYTPLPQKPNREVEVEKGKSSDIEVEEIEMD